MRSFPPVMVPGNDASILDENGPYGNFPSRAAKAASFRASSIYIFSSSVASSMVGFLFFPGQLQQVIGRFLIDHIDPIGVKQVSIAAPFEAGAAHCCHCRDSKISAAPGQGPCFTDEFILQGISVIFKRPTHERIWRMSLVLQMLMPFSALRLNTSRRGSASILLSSTRV